MIDNNDYSINRKVNLSAKSQIMLELIAKQQLETIAMSDDLIDGLILYLQVRRITRLKGK